MIHGNPQQLSKALSFEHSCSPARSVEITFVVEHWDFRRALLEVSKHWFHDLTGQPFLREMEVAPWLWPASVCGFGDSRERIMRHAVWHNTSPLLDYNEL